MADEHVPVLVLDFAATRGQDRLHAAIAAAAPDWPVSRIDPVRALARHDPPIAVPELAAELAGDWPAAPRTPIVVGYCSAAGLALRLAGRLGAPAVLVLPALPTHALVAAEFGECVRALGG